MTFHHDRGDDDRATFDPWPADHHSHHHHGHHHHYLPAAPVVSHRAMYVLAAAVICFFVLADFVLFIMSLHPRASHTQGESAPISERHR